MKKLLISGSNGFVGKYFINKYKNKYKFSKYILNKSYLNNLLLLKYSFEFRRNKKEKLFLSLLILLGVF